MTQHAQIKEMHKPGKKKYVKQKLHMVLQCKNYDYSHTTNWTEMEIGIKIHSSSKIPFRKEFLKTGSFHTEKCLAWLFLEI